MDESDTKTIKDISGGQSTLNQTPFNATSMEDKTDILVKLKSQVQACIVQDDLNGALNLMEERIADNRPLRNTFLSLKARYSNWKNASLEGILHEESKSVKHASIVHSMLELVGMLSTSDIK